MSTTNFVANYDATANKSLSATHSLMKGVYEPLHSLSLHSPFAARVVTPFAIIPLTIISLVLSVTSIAEDIIAGLGNILGSPFSKDYSFTNGIINLIVFPLAKVISTAIFLPLGFIKGLIHPIINPSDYCDSIIKDCTKHLSRIEVCQAQNKR